MVVVMAGNLSDGLTPVGPFDDFDEAAAWADKLTAVCDTWVMTIVPPSEYEKEVKDASHATSSDRPS